MALMRMFGSHPVHADALLLEEKLWQFDPRLQLKYVTREHPERKGVTGRRYEVWRHCEDGENRMIGHWLMHEFDAIWGDILAMSQTRGPDVIARIDAANAEVDAKISAEIRDNLGETMEYAAKLWHDTNNPKNVFRQVGGFRDELTKPLDAPIVKELD